MRDWLYRRQIEAELIGGTGWLQRIGLALLAVAVLGSCTLMI
jgi:hypothetical protein